MSDPVRIPDAAERQRALDPLQSFIVQAPAGSGKTGLLIQRYLRLLACVDAPEEIIAITFTRKAAAEMRERVFAALEAGKMTASNTLNAYEKLTHSLAVAVLQRDNQADWQIVENPVRLRIQTIDSLCASLTRQMPILSRFGSQPESIEDASDLYLEAARTTIKLVEQGHNTVAQSIEWLLEHLDNDVARLERLLAEMLARRDHWLRHIHSKTRNELEAALRNTRRAALGHISNLYPRSAEKELLELVRYAAAHLIEDGKDSPIAACNKLTTILADGDVAHWRGIAELLLTDKGLWRQIFTVKNGFPSGKTKAEKEIARSWKDRILALIDILKSNDTLRHALHNMRNLPPPVYTDTQWRIIGSITQLLPYAVAQLKIIFQSHGKVDFTEVAQSALLALGEPEMPTDLALALDYRIKHLLIDEFQDTSISQYILIEKLITGWEAGDGRSLFAVGDPMQSIYRFREAEVGLFLQARIAGIGNLTLQPITLCANFRSQQGIVDWVNATFTQMMPAYEDIAAGAVAYAPSVAIHKTLAVPAVKVHPFFNNDSVAEAQCVVEIILQSRRDDPSASIAILVRNRSHLDTIIFHIKEEGLRFRAIEIEALHSKSVVQDLFALTRALINPADRLAWFSILRAPWCGLTLKDLYAVSSKRTDNTIEQVKGNGKKVGEVDCTLWESLNDETQLSLISMDGIIRIRRVREILQRCIHNRYRQSLRATVEAAWLALGGPGCINKDVQNRNPSTSSLDDAMIYLDYLENNEEAGSIPNLVTFEKGLAKLYASPDLDVDDTLQIMTIHKAKGLEFDRVIVPGLGRSPRNNDKQLLKWMERPRKRFSDEEEIAGDVDLLLAPIQETGLKNDSIYAWIDKLDNEKERFEDERLLYVAATRARQFLHLLGNVSLAFNKNGVFKPRPPAIKTLLDKLWPTVYPAYTEAAEKRMSSNVPTLLNDGEIKVTKSLVFDQSLYRLVSGWALPSAPSSVVWHQPRGKVVAQNDEIEFSWAGEIARHIGNVAHRWLQKIAEDEMKGWDVARVLALRDTFKRALVCTGMSNRGKELELAVERIVNVLAYAITDKRGQWILGPQQNACNELRLTGIINEGCVDLAIDRTFCDKNGDRWIIDYKTSNHEGSNIEAFLDREQVRYRDQLNRYAQLMQMNDKRFVRLGLYFPLLKGWREWSI